MSPIYLLGSRLFLYLICVDKIELFPTAENSNSTPPKTVTMTN